MRKQLNSIALAISMCGLAGTAYAQEAGSVVVTGGTAWIDMRQSSSQELKSSSQFGTFTSPGTGAEIHNTFTGELLVTYFATEHIAIESAVGFPPKLNFFSQGVATPLGPQGPAMPVGDLKPLVTARVWAPTLFVKYYFGKKDSVWRPFLGVGVNYTWFSSVQVHPAFSGALSQFAGPGGRVDASASSSWNPAFTAGVTYRLNGRWSVLGSITYIPLKTTGKFDAVSANGTTVLSNTTRITANPIIGFVGISYRF
ncbi:OmpW/AlkL family protein [Burkholderia ambifaria]|jgi:outer membrane protein|uniref:OmpW family protein n=1 Tax=Burkholderia ambifaria TaxID=152480 RepID=A0AA41JGA4_9BURK|nr:OmpW family outer membrane protein [Burkholderia ambifaria]MBR8127478.1 OmpW family protein [Burkholderia ambifaria]PRD95912.1 OmpW family protein [Burkholderia ambifaria]UEP51405.1 outer membrane beta-barrel protein [Burkholderia ambifaria]